MVAPETFIIIFQRLRRRPERTILALQWTIVVLSGLCVTVGGTPALRHDWLWPLEGDVFRSTVENMWLGWDRDGIGAAHTYPSAFIAGWALYLAALIVPPPLLLALVTGGIAAVIAWSADACARNAGASVATRCALVAFAALNPWVYDKLIAGHLFLLLAYGAGLLLAAEFLTPEPRPLPTMLAVIASSMQPQATALIAAFLLWHPRRKAARYGLAVLTLLALPSFVGVLGDASAAYAIPFSVAWERSQSVDPLAALTFSGYFTHYDDPFVPWIRSILIATTACAFLAAYTRGRERATMLLVLLFLGIWIFASGTRGPAAAWIAAMFAHLRPLAIFRELYDLLAVLAILTIVLIARARPASAYWALPVAAAALACATAWIVRPPWTWWTSAQSIPRTAVSAASGTRFALFPAFQPLSYRGRSSGADLDAVPHNDIYPLNSYQPQYPVDSALARYEQNGDGADLIALGVTRIIARPWLSSDLSTLKEQANRPMRTQAMRVGRQLQGVPLLSALPALRPVSIGARLDAPGIFLPDAGIHTTRFASDNVEVDPSKGWVDDRFSFSAAPRDAQPYGGLVTTSSRMLALRSGARILARVEGELTDQRGGIVTRSDALTWVTLPAGARALRCRGRCVVVAQADVPAGIPSELPRTRGKALQLREITPFAYAARLEPGNARALRFIMRYDHHWTAWLGGRRLEHVRIAGVLNGWRIEPRDEGEILLVETLALAQCGLEIFGALATIALLRHAALSSEPSPVLRIPV